MSTFPASASKSFSSTPVKNASNGRDLHRSKSVDYEYDSPDDSTYSLLSPIYHDSYESDEDLRAAHHVHQIDTSASQSEDARPLSPIRGVPQKPPEGTAIEGEDPEVSLSAWERWLVCKAKEERIKVERKAEEERTMKERKDQQEREQQRKKMVVEEKIQEWLQMKREHEKQEKQQKESKEQEEVQRQKQKQMEIEQKAEEKYREWLRRKNQEKTEREKKEKEEAARKEAQEGERRQRAEEKFKEWLASAQDKSRPSPKASGCSRGGYDNISYPSPSFYNPVPWKPIHVLPPEKTQKTKLARKKLQSQPKYLHSPSIPLYMRATVSSAYLQRR